MADPKNVDIMKIKFPDVVKTEDFRKRGRTWRHSYVDTTLRVVCGENEGVQSTMIRNLSAETVWLGDRSLVAGNGGNGMPLKEDDIIIIDKSYGEIYAATENNTAILAIMEE